MTEPKSDIAEWAKVVLELGKVAAALLLAITARHTYAHYTERELEASKALWTLGAQDVEFLGSLRADNGCVVLARVSSSVTWAGRHQVWVQGGTLRVWGGRVPKEKLLAIVDPSKGENAGVVVRAPLNPRDGTATSMHRREGDVLWTPLDEQAVNEKRFPLGPGETRHDGYYVMFNATKHQWLAYMFHYPLPPELPQSKMESTVWKRLPTDFDPKACKLAGKPGPSKAPEGPADNTAGAP